MSLKWSSITMSDHVDEVEAALHFDECKLTFCNAESQSAWSMINFKKNEEIGWIFIVKCKNENIEGQMLGNSGRSWPKD